MNGRIDWKAAMFVGAEERLSNDFEDCLDRKRGSHREVLDCNISDDELRDLRAEADKLHPSDEGDLELFRCQQANKIKEKVQKKIDIRKAIENAGKIANSKEMGKTEETI